MFFSIIKIEKRHSRGSLRFIPRKDGFLLSEMDIFTNSTKKNIIVLDTLRFKRYQGQGKR